MELSGDSESSWAPSGGSSGSSEVSSSDLDEFIMTTSQSGALSRQRKKAKQKDDESASRLLKKKKKKKKLLSTPIGRVSQEVRDLLGQGHNAFLKRDYDTAVALLEEAIRLAPGVADPFVTLGAIYEELNDSKRSLEALLLAVHLTPGDTELWKRVSVKSESVGNIDQAIYCLKRCVKAAAGDRLGEEGFLRDLAHLHVRAGRFNDAAGILNRIFSIEKCSPEDAVELGSLLAKSLYNINEKTEAMNVLESLVNSPSIEIDANIINMLAEVYLDVREWGRCFSLLTSVLDMENLQDPEKCPVDLVAKLALAAAPSFERHERICTQAVACVLSTPVESHHDLYVLVADGLIANNNPTTAWTLLEPALTALGDAVPSIKGKAGKCCYLLGRFEEAAQYLFDSVEFDKQQLRKPEPDSLVMLADAFRKTGREQEAGDLLLHSLNYEDLLACRTLPTATSTTQRRKMLETLNHLLATYPSLEAADATTLGAVQNKFANTYLHLLNDCELDSQRVARHRAQTQGGLSPEVTGGSVSVDDAMSVSGSQQRLTPAWRLRKELDLEGIEETVGPDKFVELVTRGSKVCAMAGRGKEAVELIEAVLYNKRKKWSQVDGGELLLNSLENLSFDLSVKASGLHKISTKYLRQAVTAAGETGGTTADIVSGIAKMTHLMFHPKSDYTQREILDQRSWLVRQACKNPLVFAFTMMCGHLCVYSSNFRFACQEFLKAHRLAPTDPWPLVCLGANLLSLAMSRTTKDRQLTVLRAFGVLSMYAKLRSPVNAAEVHYNMGRAFHQLSLWYLADREYRKALECVDGNIRALAAYNLSLIWSRAEGSSDSVAKLLCTNIVAS